MKKPCLLFPVFTVGRDSPSGRTSAAFAMGAWHKKAFAMWPSLREGFGLALISSEIYSVPKDFSGLGLSQTHKLSGEEALQRGPVKTCEL